MLPEISHRCHSCGASVREANALFCPECGKPLANEQQNESVDEAAESEATTHPESADGSRESIISSADNDDAPQAEASTQTVSTDGSMTEAEVAAAPAAAPSEPASLATQPSKEPAAAKVTADLPSQESPTGKTSAGAPDHAHRIGDKTRERLHRASAAARGVIEDEVKRVEKIRHVSTTVIEEAHYDPSLRFVLVALGLFVVFVILLVLSKVMG